MFKKGQLVKTMYGSFGIIKKKSTVYRSSYVVSLLSEHGLSSAAYYREYEINLIGNNFKFKGGSDGRII